MSSGAPDSRSMSPAAATLLSGLIPAVLGGVLLALKASSLGWVLSIVVVVVFVVGLALPVLPAFRWRRQSDARAFVWEVPLVIGLYVLYRAGRGDAALEAAFAIALAAWVGWLAGAMIQRARSLHERQMAKTASTEN